jgi:transposase
LVIPFSWKQLEADMSGLFWLNDKQWLKLEPLLPTDTRGRRVDDRRIISGIIHALKSGGRWGDVPSEYGPKKTLYNRYVRWAKRGVWQEIFMALAAAGGPPAEALIDSTHVKVHRSAGGAKGGLRHTRLVYHVAGVIPKST